MTNTKVPLVIYHSPCQDGFTAAWTCWKKHPNWEYHPAKYGEEPPDVTGRDVYMLDFSYKRPVLEQMAQKAISITIIDHHKTAEADLKDIYLSYGWVYVIFDMEHSGAYLAWQYFHSNKDIPEIIKYVEDRDLWKFKFEQTKAISSALFAYPYDFETWDTLAKDLDFDSYMLADEGHSILRNHQKYTEELAALKFKMNIGGYAVWAVNVPYNYSSDMGNLLCKGEPFAATYFYDGATGKLKFSLRSDENGLDVSEIAKMLGGGGHKNAAGFEVNYAGPLGYV